MAFFPSEASSSSILLFSSIWNSSDNAFGARIFVLPALRVSRWLARDRRDHAPPYAQPYGSRSRTFDHPSIEHKKHCQRRAPSSGHARRGKCGPAFWNNQTRPPAIHGRCWRVSARRTKDVKKSSKETKGLTCNSIGCQLFDQQSMLNGIE